jgi:hypothetical protein
MSCRICGNTKDSTKECCPTPLESENCMSKDDFEKLMYEVWGNSGIIPLVTVRDFYNDWINGNDINAKTYLENTSTPDGNIW